MRTFLLLFFFLSSCAAHWPRANTTRLVDLIVGSLDRLEAALYHLNATGLVGSLDRLEAALYHLNATGLAGQRRGVLRARKLLSEPIFADTGFEVTIPPPTPPLNSEGLPYPLDENGYYDSAPDDELPCIACNASE